MLKSVRPDYVRCNHDSAAPNYVRQNLHGFTLIELLITIAILAILTAIGVAVFRNVASGARDSRRKADVESIAKAYEMIYANGYNTVTGINFSSGVIPAPPEGSTGGNNGAYFNALANDGSGFKVCAALESNPSRICHTSSVDCYCINSAQGSITPGTPPSGLTGTNTSIGLGGTVVSDTFTRADSAITMGNAETGQTWTDASDVVAIWGISSNQAYFVSGGNNHIKTVIDSGFSDATIQVTLSTVHGNSRVLAWRVTDAYNYYYITQDSAQSKYGIIKRVNGVASDLGQISKTPANGDVIKIVLSASSMQFYVNGTLYTTISDSFNQTATKHGLTVSYGDTTSRFDNFSVSN